MARPATPVATKVEGAIPVLVLQSVTVAEPGTKAVVAVKAVVVAPERPESLTVDLDASVELRQYFAIEVLQPSASAEGNRCFPLRKRRHRETSISSSSGPNHGLRLHDCQPGATCRLLPRRHRLQNAATTCAPPGCPPSISSISRG